MENGAVEGGVVAGQRFFVQLCEQQKLVRFKNGI